MPLNVKLLERIKQHILEEPARLRMDLWLLKKAPGKEITTHTPGYNEPETYTIPKCGTVGCIAGWAAELTNPSVNPDGYEVRAETAQEILGISSYREPFDLFYVDHWPHELCNLYYNAKDADERAKVTARTIDTYIHEYKEYKEE